jgi:hypothetical protein
MIIGLDYLVPSSKNLFIRKSDQDTISRRRGAVSQCIQRYPCILLTISNIALLLIHPSAVFFSQPLVPVASPTATDPKSSELIVMLGISDFDSQ